MLENQLSLDMPYQNECETKFTSEDIIVLSLHKSAWELVLSGRKKYEFRRRFRRKPAIAFVYVTLPVKAICGYMILGNAIEGNATEIAQIAEKAIKGNGKSVYDYFIEKDFGLAIPINEVVEINPIPLSSLRDNFNFVAPQFYHVLDKKHELRECLLEHANLKI